MAARPVGIVSMYFVYSTSRRRMAVLETENRVCEMCGSQQTLFRKSCVCAGLIRSIVSSGDCEHYIVFVHISYKQAYTTQKYILAQPLAGWWLAGGQDGQDARE